MRPHAMHRLAHNGCHVDDAPKAWHSVPNMTGDYDLDATILHRSNHDLPARLALYLKKPGQMFSPRTAYNSYHGNHGDD